MSSSERSTSTQSLPEAQCVVRARIPSKLSSLFLHVYTNSHDEHQHLAIVFGPHIRSKSLNQPRPGETAWDRTVRGAESEPSADAGTPPLAADPEPVLVRVHSECYTGDTIWSTRCDCGDQLREAGRIMGDAGRGVIIYLRQEGRGIGLVEKLKAYNLQDKLSADTVEANLLLHHPADAREYGVATSILCDLSLARVRLLTNNPEKIRELKGPGGEVTVVERIPMVPFALKGDITGNNKELRAYLKARVEKMGYLLDLHSVPLWKTN